MHLRDVVCLAWAAARQHSSDIVVCCSVFSDFTSELVDVFGETSTAVRGKQFLGLIEFRYPLAQVTFYPKDCLRRLIKYRGSWVKVGRGSVPIKKNKNRWLNLCFLRCTEYVCMCISKWSFRQSFSTLIHSFIHLMSLHCSYIVGWMERKERTSISRVSFFSVACEQVQPDLINEH